MRARLTIVLLITGALLPRAVAQENTSAQNTNTATTCVPQQPPGSRAIRQAQAPLESRDVEGYPQPGSRNPENTIVVDVWSSTTSTPVTANEAEGAKLSPDFAASALTATFRMQATERKIANSIRRGFPLGEFWIQNDLEGIDESLRVAALSVTNESDRQALQQLENQNSRLRQWSDWLMDANRNLRLGDYFMSESVLENDERFQNTVACTKFLVSMLASRRLKEDSSCP